MSGWQQHRNPWAEKLSQVALPDAGESWMAMEALLDREMPVRRAREWRRWVLLILLLLLLIGVCHCPGRNWFLSGHTKVEPTKPPAAVGPAPGGSGAANPVAGPATADSSATPPAAALGKRGPGKPGTGKPGSGKPGPAGHTPGGPSAAAVVEARDSGKTGRPVLTHDRTAPPHPVTVNHERTATREPAAPSQLATATRKRAKTPRPNPVNVGPAATAAATKKPDLRQRSSTIPKDTVTTADEISSNGESKKPDEKKPAEDKKKSDEKKQADEKKIAAAKRREEQKKKADEENKKENEKTDREHGWMVGIGLNQFFTIGGQHASSYNSGGLTGTLGDYIPVPMVRYYFGPNLYVQLEAQINTPQYTKKNLVAVQTKIDSLTPVQTVQRSVSINKLFYFNVPLSIHYTVYDHLDLGAGLQYSRLTNGIGVFDANFNNSGTDSLSTETKSFKGDSAYKEIKTHEFRFLVDANYTWKHFIVGVRYNQALSKFIHVEIQPGQVTQARNSSLQLYLRYILWDGRKKKTSSASK